MTDDYLNREMSLLAFQDIEIQPVKLPLKWFGPRNREAWRSLQKIVRI
jgi:hypothetical protein